MQPGRHLTGVGIVGLILLVVSAVLATVIVGPLVLGVLFPLEPPKATGDQAVLRVMAPPGKYYKVERGGAWWQFWREEGGFVGKVGEGRLAKDHAVKPTGDGHYELRVTKVARQGEEGHEKTPPGWKGNLRAILYVGGEVATCDGASESPLKLVWREGDGTDELATRALCGRYRWARFIPGYLPWAMLGVVSVLFLTLMGMNQPRVEVQRTREQEKLARQTEKEKQQRTTALLRGNTVRVEIDDMSGPKFKRYMADLFRQRGYVVRETRATGDQGVDLLLTKDHKRVAVQLKRWTGRPVGNAVVAATFAGIAHYRADEGWIITTSTFTKSARQLAKSTRVRLIDGKELAEWLEDLRE